MFVATTNKLIAHPVIDIEQVVSVLTCILDQFWREWPEEGERKRERGRENKGEGERRGKGREGKGERERGREERERERGRGLVRE